MSATLANVYSSVPSTTRARPFVLNGDPKGENFLYACGSCIVIRNIHNPLIADLYDQHSHQATVAKYCPSGFYIASGDVKGNVRIWDTLSKEHILKGEYRPISGAIYDIDWSEDSKRIVVGGEGREKHGHAFFMDGGASVGEISNHSKMILSCSMKPNRPYRIATGSEDFTVNWFEGPPFKYKAKFESHSRFVNTVRFAPDGSLLASGGSDKNIVLYDGKTGEKKSVLEGHGGGVYGVSWSPNSAQLLSASADKTCRIWDVATGQVVSTFNLGNTVNDQQLGCLWQGNYLLSVNLAGHITYLDQNSPAKPLRVLKGHNKFVTSLTVDKATRSLYSGSYDAVITRWNADDGSNEVCSGSAPQNQVVQMVVDSGRLVAGSMDDNVSFGAAGGLNFDANVGVDAPVVGVDSANGTTVVATLNSVFLVRGGAVAANVKLGFQPGSVAISPDGSEVAVGGDSDSKLHLLNANLAETKVLGGHRQGITAVRYSPDGKYIATGGKDRLVNVYDRNGNQVQDSWINHGSTVKSVDWNEDSTRIASGGLDQNVIVWSLATPNARVEIRGAHRGGVNSVKWLDANTLVTAGQDCVLKSWNVTQ